MGSPARPLQNPKTGDWTLTLGQRTADDSYKSAVVFAIKQVYGSSPAYPTIGTKFHPKFGLFTKMTDDITRRAELEVERALKHLTTPRKITDLVATATASGTLLTLDVQWKDSKGQRNAEKFSISVGV